MLEPMFIHIFQKSSGYVLNIQMTKAPEVQVLGNLFICNRQDANSYKVDINRIKYNT